MRQLLRSPSKGWYQQFTFNFFYNIIIISFSSCRYSITLLAWVYPEANGGEIISYWQSSSYGVSLLLENSRPVFHVYSRDLTAKHSVTSNSRLQLHQWHHIAGSYSNASGSAEVYVDGITVGNKTNIGGLQLRTEYDLWLGYLFKGRVAQVWIFNVSLPSQEISQAKDVIKPSSSK